MTTVLESLRPLSPVQVRTTVGRLGVAALAGTALGFVDLGLQLTLPYPLANLANSSAVWALCAFAFGWLARTTAGVAALGATVLLVVAVEAYYLAAFVLDRGGLATMWSPVAVAWMTFGVIAGVVFGVAGAWVRSGTPWRAAAGLAAASAVFVAEAGVRLLPGSGSGLADLGTALLNLAFAVAVLLAAVARPALLARAVLLLPVCAVLGIVGFRLAGY